MLVTDPPRANPNKILPLANPLLYIAMTLEPIMPFFHTLPSSWFDLKNSVRTNPSTASTPLNPLHGTYTHGDV